MPFASTATARIAYTCEGSGPGLVLLHGTGGDGFSNWGHLVRHFSDRYTVVCPDYAGSGASEDDGGELSVATLAEQAMAAAQAAGLTSFDLVGYSLGAVIAARIAAGHPALVRSLVLVAGFAGGPESRSQLQFRLWRDLIGSDRDAMARLILLTGFSPAFLSGQSADELDKRQAAILKFTRWEGMARQTELDLRLDIRAETARLNVPTRVIGCAQDQMVPVHLVRALASQIAGADYVEIDSGHLVTLEKPQEVVNAITTFIRQR